MEDHPYRQDQGYFDQHVCDHGLRLCALDGLWRPVAAMALGRLQQHLPSAIGLHPDYEAAAWLQNSSARQNDQRQDRLTAEREKPLESDRIL